MKKKVIISVTIIAIALSAVVVFAQQSLSRDEKKELFESTIEELNYRVNNPKNTEEHDEVMNEIMKLVEEAKHEDLIEIKITKEDLLFRVNSAKSALIDSKKIFTTESKSDSKNLQILNEHIEIYDRFENAVIKADEDELNSLNVKFTELSKLTAKQTISEPVSKDLKDLINDIEK